VPLIGAIAFRWYFSVTLNNNSLGKLTGFIEVLCMAFPLVIGLICGEIADQEVQAGNYQVILSEACSRGIAYMSKLILLLLLSGISLAFTVGIFSAGINAIPPWLYFHIVLAAWGANAFLYILHVFIGFRFGRSASIGLGVLGSLISSLMMTGLGDGIWRWIPWAWSAHLCGDIVFSLQNPSETVSVAADMQNGITVCFVVTVLSLFASLLWFQRWEGSKFNE
jgi:ABC-2 type transport system permease protein